MKTGLFLLSILITPAAFCQGVTGEKLWAGSDNVYFIADTAVIRFETFYPGRGNYRTAKKYTVRGDTLRIIQNDFHYGSLTADFLITSSKKGELVLRPVEVNASLLTNLITGTGVKEQLRFTHISQVYTDTIRFEKIIFNSTTCYGHCPDMTLQINNKKQVQFTGREYAVKQGSFISTIPDTLFHELTEILKLAELDKIESNKQTNIDAPTYTLEIHYNNKTKYLRSCMLPFVTDNLLQYLLALPGKLKLIENKENTDIKFSNN